MATVHSIKDNLSQCYEDFSQCNHRSYMGLETVHMSNTFVLDDGRALRDSETDDFLEFYIQVVTVASVNKFEALG